MGRSRFLYGLERTPDDRLNWSPGGAARSPLQQADRAAQFLTFVSYWLKNRAMRSISTPDSLVRFTTRSVRSFG